MHNAYLTPFGLPLLFLIVSACGSAHTPGDSTYAASVAPGTRAPADQVEQTILERLADVPAGETQTIEGAQVSVSESYTSASGRTCRRVSITGSAARESLACLMPGGWSFVPNVFVENAGT